MGLLCLPIFHRSRKAPKHTSAPVARKAAPGPAPAAKSKAAVTPPSPYLIVTGSQMHRATASEYLSAFDKSDESEQRRIYFMKAATAGPIVIGQTAEKSQMAANEMLEELRGISWSRVGTKVFRERAVGGRDGKVFLAVDEKDWVEKGGIVPVPTV